MREIVSIWRKNERSKELNTEIIKTRERMQMDKRERMNKIYNQGKSYLLYISTSVWVLCTPNAGRNSHFPVDQRSGANLKKPVFAKI